MAENSTIEWTNHTFNIVWGCTKVSPACKNCYAEAWAKRYGFEVWGKTGRRVLSDSYWKQPIRWNRLAQQSGQRFRVFCSSMADVFEDHSVVATQRERLWPLIEATPNLDWLLLTKRPENVMPYIPKRWRMQLPFNIWVGTTAENQKYLNARFSYLAEIPSAVRFLSAEPLLGPLDLSEITTSKLDWLIVGGESGPGARPMRSEWVLSLLRQSKKLGISFFFKQWGEFAPLELGDQRKMERLGKKKAGRHLCSKTWNEIPRQRDLRTAAGI